MASDILIKGMVCERCISVIKERLSNLGYNVGKISLGKVSLQDNLTKHDYDKISQLLSENGFEIVSNRQVRIVSQAKEIISEVFGENMKYDMRLKFSTLLSEKLHMNYDSISELFTELEGMTLEKVYHHKTLGKSKRIACVFGIHTHRNSIHHWLQQHQSSIKTIQRTHGLLP